MSKITKLNNFGSTKGIDLKLIPVTGLEIEDDWWHHQHCDVIRRIIYRPEPFFSYLVCKMPIWWRHNVDDVINRLLLSRPITGVSLVPIPLVDPEIWARSVKYRPVCRIHVGHDMTMKPIVTFSFCQNLLLDKVSWWLDKNWLLNSTFGFAQLYPRILDHLLVTPWNDIWKFFYIKRWVLES